MAVIGSAGARAVRRRRAPGWRLPGNGALRLALAVAAVTALAGLALEPMWAGHPTLVVMSLATCAAYLGTAGLLASDRDQRGTAFALAASGITVPLGWLDVWNSGPFPLYTWVFGNVAEVFGAWALLRYPDSHLSRRHRRFLILLAGWVLAVPVALAFVSRPWWLESWYTADAWWPSWWPNARVFGVASDVLDSGEALLAAAFIGLVLARVCAAGSRERVTLLPVVCAAVVAAVSSAVVAARLAVGAGGDDVYAGDNVYAIDEMAQLTVPIAFFVSVVQQRLGRMVGLVAEFDRTAPTARLLRGVLRVNLRDPDLDLLVRAPDGKGYLTVDGRAAELRRLAVDRRVEPVVGGDGRRLAVLITHPSAGRDRGLLTTAAVMTRLILENVRLSTDLREQLERVQELTVRRLAAEYEVRQRIVADLHDGAQKELCGLLVVLSAARRAADDATRVQLDEARQRVTEALRELRDLAHEVYPHTLSLAGLRAAVEETASRLDLPADIDATAERLPPAVEKTLYFVICEALTNAAKHAHAGHVEVAVRCEAGRDGRDGADGAPGDAADGVGSVAGVGSVVLATVADDGVGGADGESLGLSRLRDRVQAHGGELTIDSPRGGGTQLTVRIPCG